ncbi:Flavanone 3-dioxygenase 3 [Bienertia sinuspersici]
MEEEKRSENYKAGQSAQEVGSTHVPLCYEVPHSQRPNLDSTFATEVPLVDLAALRLTATTVGPSGRSAAIRTIRQACLSFGIFQIVNHGIEQSVLDKAMNAADEFFKLPGNEKLKLMSNDVHKSVRYGTSLKDGVDKLQFWRVFLKHYANPLNDWLQSWPPNPPTYREDMGAYSSQVQKLALELAEGITESLGLSPKYMSEKIKDGMQVIVVNCYPPCPEPRLTLGLPSHSDYSCFTILHQSSPGLEIKVDAQDSHCSWQLVPYIDGALQVLIGDHFEVLSNGFYKSVVHRAILNSEKTRISIASLHSLGMDETVEPAYELVDGDHPKAYKGSSFKDFLDFLSVNSDAFAQGKVNFLDTLQLN